MSKLAPLLLSTALLVGCAKTSFRYHTAFGDAEAENEFADVVVRFSHLSHRVGLLEVRNNDLNEVRVIWDEAAAVWGDGLQHRLAHGLDSASTYQSVVPQPVVPGSFIQERIRTPSRCFGRQFDARIPNLSTADALCPDWRDEQFELVVPFEMNDHRYVATTQVKAQGVDFEPIPNEKERALALYLLMVLDQ